MSNLTLQLPPDLKQKVADLAREQNVPQKFIAIDAIARWLEVRDVVCRLPRQFAPPREAAR